MQLALASSAPAVRRAHHLTGASLAQSFDGCHLAVAHGDGVWLEDTRAGKQTRLAIAPGHDLAVTSSRVWIARAGLVESMPIDGDGAIVDVTGDDTRIVAAAHAIVVTSTRGTYLVRDDGDVVELAPRPMQVRAIGEARFLLWDRDGQTLVDVAGPAPRAIRLGVSARILDATWVLDRSTFVLLLARGDAQELAVMRASGSVLSRIRVARVHRIAGAARAYVVALAVDDGRVLGFDLREHRAVSVDRPATSACELVLDPDARRLVGLAHGSGGPQLFSRAL